MRATTSPKITSSGRVLEELQKVLQTSIGGRGIQELVRVQRESSSNYSWVGVYLVNDQNLVLEAYAGDAETEHVSIPIGEGICGSAAKFGETIIVPDVSKDSRYLMCFPSTRSEIVVPISGKTGVIGEIDIDSDRLGAFSEGDRKLLEQAAASLAVHLEKVPAKARKNL